jgi:nitrite reductase/ring-hydroxylating ferredoxin subunit
MWFEAFKQGDVAPGGVKYVRAGDEEIAVCRVDGEYYAVGRRCGHKNAPMERGSLDSVYLTCPLHYVRFDVRTGQALNDPIERYHDDERPPGPDNRPGKTPTGPEEKVRDLPTYAVRVRDGVVEVELPGIA